MSSFPKGYLISNTGRILQEVLRRFQRETALFLLIGRGADTNGDSIRLTLDALKISHGHGDEVA